jgi:pSer/pThr/pTyr-binding forkhead associated (FHA) protein
LPGKTALEGTMAYLEIRIAQEVRRFALDRNYLRVGRTSENDIVLRDAQISRQHAELRLNSGHWRILDLGSTNGLHVRGQRVREHALNNGDMVLLAPNIALCFSEDAAPPDARPLQTSPEPRTAPPPWNAPPQYAPPVPAAPEPQPFDMLRPRSPFADDEQPYYPPGIGTPAPPTHYNRQSAPQPAPPAPAARAAYDPSAQFDTLPGGGYPAPSGPLTSGSDGHDPFRRSGPDAAAEAHRKTSGPSSALLHVCQTCGQLTAPDSVYCHSCHHSIARECVNCRLSLLPIQDRCPRCQTPNPGSVRRAHRAPSA